MAGGVSQANRAMNQTANRVGNVAAAGAGAAVGNIAGKSSSSGGCPKKMSHNE